MKYEVHIIGFLLPFLATSQVDLAPTIDKLQGVWSGRIVDHFDQDTVYYIDEYYLIQGKKSLIIDYLNGVASVYSDPFSYMGFWDLDHLTNAPENISDLREEGEALLFYDFRDIHFDEFGNLYTPTRTCFITMNENEPPSDTIPKYFHLSCGRAPEPYGKTGYIPTEVLKSLKEKGENWQKYQDFVATMPMQGATIGVDKTYIYSEPEVATKMYLIENDTTIEVLEKQEE
ncbi:MAG: hypothetical protein AAGC88_12885 [Bacteroidota bacterium]